MGVEALRAWARTPVTFTPVKSEFLTRLLIADLLGDQVTRESRATLREDIADVFACLEESEGERGTASPPQPVPPARYRFLRRLLDLHLEWVLIWWRAKRCVTKRTWTVRRSESETRSRSAGVELELLRAAREGLGGVMLELEGDEALVADHPGVVAWLDDVGLARSDVELGTVIVRDVHRPALDDPT